MFVTESRDDAGDAVRRYLSGDAFGDAGRTVVIEEGLRGPELSLLVVCNGDPDGAVPLAPAQDFKRIGDGDTGPNTGGMGAYSPVRIAGRELVEQVMAVAVRPTLHSLAARGAPYRGVLYAGLMLTADGPKVIEYNVRFGDPECQVVVPRLASDLGELCTAAARGAALPPVTFDDDACVTVVLASGGYPATPVTGERIIGLDTLADQPEVVVFHAATAARRGRVARHRGWARPRRDRPGRHGHGRPPTRLRGGRRDHVARDPVPARHRGRGVTGALPAAAVAARVRPTGATGPNARRDERALDAPGRLTLTDGRDETLAAERLAALVAAADGALVPVLRARPQAEARVLPAVHGRPSRWLDPLRAGAGHERARVPDRPVQCRPGGSPP